MNLTSFWMQSGWFKALGWTFVHSLWQIAVIGLLLYITLRLIPGRKANVRYSISTMAIWMIVISALCTFIIMLPESKTITELSGLVMISKSVEELSLRDKISIWLESRMPMMMTVWLGGVLILMIRLAFSLGWVRHMRTTAQFSGDIQEKLDEIIKRIRVNIKVTASESIHVNSPVTIGHLKPLILFPIGIINQLTPNEVEAILTHELAHIVRRDYLSNLIQSFIETLFYYHPVTWWISRMVRSERENRADDLAVSWCGDHLSYAKALMTVEEMQLQQPASLALGFASNKGAMLARIQRILHIPYKNHNQMEKTVLLSLCSLCFLAFTFTNNVKQEEPTKEEKTAYVEKTLILDTNTDTIPSEGTYRIHKKTDEQDITIEVEDGDIKELKIDGKQIEPSEFEEYDEVISELFGEMSAAPVMEGTFYGLPAMPPLPDMPPMPQFYGLPAMPPMTDMPHIYAMPELTPLTEMDLEGMYKNGYKIGSLKTENGERFKMFFDTTGDAQTQIIIYHNGDSSVIMSPGSIRHWSVPGTNINEDMLKHLRAPAVDMEKYMQSEEWQKYAEELEKQGKVWQEQAEDWKKNWEENGQQWEFEFRGEQERLNEELGRLNEYQLRFSEDLRDNQGEWAEQQQLMDEIRKEQELHGHLYALRPSRMSIDQALVEDGLIERGEEAIIHLTPDKLKINGKKMDAETHQKYLRMYESQQGVELSGNSRVEFKTKSRRSM